MFADPQVKHRGLVQHAKDPELGEVPHIRTPIRIGDGIKVRAVAPKLGQHNAEVFGALRVHEAELKGLRANGVLYRGLNTEAQRQLEAEPCSCAAGNPTPQIGRTSSRESRYQYV